MWRVLIAETESAKILRIYPASHAASSSALPNPPASPLFNRQEKLPFPQRSEKDFGIERFGNRALITSRSSRDSGKGGQFFGDGQCIGGSFPRTRRSHHRLPPSGFRLSPRSGREHGQSGRLGRRGYRIATGTVPVGAQRSIDSTSCASAGASTRISATDVYTQCQKPRDGWAHRHRPARRDRS